MISRVTQAVASGLGGPVSIVSSAATSSSLTFGLVDTLGEMLSLLLQHKDATSLSLKVEEREVMSQGTWSPAEAKEGEEIDSPLHPPKVHTLPTP